MPTLQIARRYGARASVALSTVSSQYALKVLSKKVLTVTRDRKSDRGCGINDRFSKMAAAAAAGVGALVLGSDRPEVRANCRSHHSDTAISGSAVALSDSSGATL